MDAKLFISYLPWLRVPDYYYEMKRGFEGWDEENISNGIEWAKQDTTPLTRRKPLVLPEAPMPIQLLYSENNLKNLRIINHSYHH